MSNPSFKLVKGISTLVVFVAVFLGGLALHLWTCYLFYHYWGGFWAFIVFGTPFIGELVALVACFYWHMWYYILAVALFCIAAIGAFFTSDDQLDTFRPAITRSLFVIWFFAVFSVSISFGHLASQHSFGPTSQSAFEKSQIEDSAIAAIVLLHISASKDPKDLTALVSAKKDFKDAISDFSKRDLDKLCSIVDEDLRCEGYAYRNLLEFINECRKSGQLSKFQYSPKVMRQLEKLPVKVRNVVNDTLTSVEQVRMTDELSAAAPKLPENWKDLLAKQISSVWAAYGNTYADLLNRPMPDPETLSNDYDAK